MSRWVFQQSTDQSLASDFISQLSLDSSTNSQLLCQPCKLDDQSIPAYGYCQTCAEHLCQACYQTHCKPAPLRNHILLDKTQMPQTQGSGINKEETCEFHRGKAIEYFCQDHQVLGCSPCITINHRGCSKIDYIPEAAEDFNNSTEYRQLLSDIDDLKRQGETLKMSTAKDQETIMKRKDAIKQEIRAFSEECLQKIKVWENTLMQQNDTLHDAEYAKATTVADQCVKTIETATKLQTNFTEEILKNSGNQSTLFIQTKKSAKTVQTMMTNIEQCKNNNQIQEYTLVRNQNIRGMFQFETNLGHLSKNQSMFLTETNFGQVLSSPRYHVPGFNAFSDSNSSPLTTDMQPQSDSFLSFNSSRLTTDMQPQSDSFHSFNSSRLITDMQPQSDSFLSFKSSRLTTDVQPQSDSFLSFNSSPLTTDMQPRSDSFLSFESSCLTTDVQPQSDSFCYDFSLGVQSKRRETQGRSFLKPGVKKPVLRIDFDMKPPKYDGELFLVEPKTGLARLNKNKGRGKSKKF